MYLSGPWPLKILMFALLVTREIATYSWHANRPKTTNIPQRCWMFNLDSCWLWPQMPFELDIDGDAKQMANQSQKGTWWCEVWTHVCQHCFLWWFSLQWHANPIFWQSISYHCTILLIDWDYATKGLAHPLWVPAHDLRYR